MVSTRAAKVTRAKARPANLITRTKGDLGTTAIGCRGSTLAPNGSRLSCGRNAHRRKAEERQKQKLASEATQFFPRGRPTASTAGYTAPHESHPSATHDRHNHLDSHLY